MRKITLLASFVILAWVVSIPVNAQDVATDNDGKPIFTIPGIKKMIPEVALNNLGLNYTPLHLKRVKYYVLENNERKYSMYKSTTINLKGNIISNSEDVLLIGKDLKVTPHIEIGINRGFDTLINPSRIGHYYTFSGAVFADFQNFDLYDTANKKFLDTYHRTSYGAKVNLNIFYGTKSALAFNLSYQNSIVIDDQTSFQKKSSNTIYVDNNIASNGTSDGYLSPVTPSKNWRFSIAFPQFLNSSNLTLIPYYFVKFGEGITPKNNAGILFTVLNDKFRNFDRPNGAFDQTARYTFKTAFSIGLNLLSTGTDKHNYIFLSGTISFGKAKPKVDKIQNTPITNGIF